MIISSSYPLKYVMPNNYNYFMVTITICPSYTAVFSHVFRHHILRIPFFKVFLSPAFGILGSCFFTWSCLAGPVWRASFAVGPSAISSGTPFHVAGALVTGWGLAKHSKLFQSNHELAISHHQPSSGKL